MSDETQFIYVTSTGWKSGNPHEIEIWFVEHEGSYYIVSEGQEKAHWVQNIQKHPAISIRLNGVTSPGTGRLVDNDQEPELANAVSNKMDIKYGWSEGLIVELKPDTELA